MRERACVEPHNIRRASGVSAWDHVSPRNRLASFLFQTEGPEHSAPPPREGAWPPGAPGDLGGGQQDGRTRWGAKPALGLR